MDELQLLVDLHKDGPRQGPGGDHETRLAVALSGLKRASGLEIADIGCGTGASTLVRARELDAHITAIDCFPGYLDRHEGSAGAKAIVAAEEKEISLFLAIGPECSNAVGTHNV